MHRFLFLLILTKLKKMVKYETIENWAMSLEIRPLACSVIPLPPPYIYFLNETIERQPLRAEIESKARDCSPINQSLFLYGGSGITLQGSDFMEDYQKFKDLGFTYKI